MNNQTEQPILETRDLSMTFYVGNALSRAQVRAVQNANIQLYRGKVTALVGESGSGKSTIIRMLARLHEPTSGQIIFKGRDVSQDTSRKALLRYRSEVQMIFQDPFSSLNPVHKVRYHLERPLRIHKKASKQEDINARVEELLARVSLVPTEEFAPKFPHQLSGGQRQRVAIARALAVEPEVMLADEPISMLDVSIRMGILNLMAKLRDENNIAFLYVTHDLASARYFADDTQVMYAGHIVEKAASEDLVQDPKHPYTQLLLSAVPDPARGLRTDDEIDAKGEIPSLVAIGDGCPFTSRCPHVMTKCHEAMPPVTHLSESRWVRCYLYEDEPQAIHASMSASGIR